MFKFRSKAEHTLHKKNYKVISLVVSEINVDYRCSQNTQNNKFREIVFRTY